MKVRLSDDAELDLVEAVAFYDRNGRSAGDHFYACIWADLRSLELLGGIHSMRNGFSCMSVKRFPFAIYYFMQDDVIAVVAILDERRDPDWVQWRMRRG